MSRVIVAKNAGFCPGVRAATERLARCVRSAARGEKICTLGHLIHNEDYNQALEKAGVVAVTADQLPAIAAATDAKHKATVFIRAHGIPLQTRHLLERLTHEHPAFSFEDCTCPFVSKIHRIAADMSEETPSKFLFYSVSALENGMFEARAELIYFDDRDRLTAEPTGTLSAYALDGSYSFKGNADDAVSMAGCADSFAVLADRTFDFLNGGDFEVIAKSVPADEDPINFAKELDAKKFKAMYERIYNK